MDEPPLGYYIKAMDLKPYPTAPGMRNMQRFMKAQNPVIADVKVEDVLDGGLIKKLDDSGFIDQICSSYGINSYRVAK
jgi:hypothetical protein